MRRTLADIKASSIPKALGMCATDERLIPLINEAQERLVPLGNWWGTYARYRCQATDGLLVWPPEVAAIQSYAVCGMPIKGRDMFFEFIELGLGIQDDTNSSFQAVDRGNTPVFKQVTGSKRIKVYNDLATDEGVPVLVLGWDENGNWVRTQQGGVWLDGEIINSSGAGTLGVIEFGSITAVQKPATSGPIRLYAYDSVSLLQYAMAVYQHFETNPNYRVSYISALDTCASTTNPQTIDVVVKLDFIPVVLDTDYMLIGNIPALKDMAVAINLSNQEATMEKKASAIMAGISLARMALEAELRHYIGAPKSHVSIQGSGGPTNEPIEQLV